MQKLLIILGSILASMFAGLVLGVIVAFALAAFYPDKYSGESSMALLPIPLVTMSISVVVGLWLASNQIDKMDTKKKS